MNKTKKKYPSQTKENKKHTNKTWSVFCVGQPLLDTGLTLSVVHRPSDISLRTTDLPFPSRGQLQTPPWLVVRFCVYFSFSVLDLVWFELVHLFMEL